MRGNAPRPGGLRPALALSVCALALATGSPVAAQGDAEADATLDCGTTWKLGSSSWCWIGMARQPL